MTEKYSFIVEECFQASNLKDEFIKRHNIKIHNNQMLITGQACRDLKTGDILLSESIQPITILNFFAYRHEMDFISAGMTCAIVIEPISENLAGQKLIVNKHNVKKSSFTIREKVNYSKSISLTILFLTNTPLFLHYESNVNP